MSSWVSEILAMVEIKGHAHVDSKENSKNVAVAHEPNVHVHFIFRFENGEETYRLVSHGLGWPANAILFLPIVKGSQKLQNTPAPIVSNIAH